MAPARRLRVLHLASFTGNVGDNAMHDGAYRTRAADLSVGLDYERREIRDFIHWRTRAFDDRFVEEANAHDVVLVGGDSVFAPFLEATETGTYFDVPPAWFDRIERPIVFYGVGCDGSRGVTPAAARGMRDFLEAFLGRDDRLLSFRNDGSRGLVQDASGLALDEAAIIPDGGLFARVEAAAPSVLPDDLRWVAVNLAGDMPDVRFAGLAGGADAFVAALSRALEAVAAAVPDAGIVVLPHIHSDLAAASALMGRLDDRLRRTRFAVGPYVQGEGGWRSVFGQYARAEAVLAMRFHATLVPLGFERPVTALATHPKVAAVMHGLDLHDRVVTVGPEGLAEDLAERLIADLLRPDATLADRTRAAVDRERAALAGFHARLDGFLERWCP